MDSGLCCQEQHNHNNNTHTLQVLANLATVWTRLQQLFLIATSSVAHEQTRSGSPCLTVSTLSSTIVRVRNEKIEFNKTNWVPNQYTEYLNLILKAAKRAAPTLRFSRKKLKCYSFRWCVWLFSVLKNCYFNPLITIDAKRRHAV